LSQKPTQTDSRIGPCLFFNAAASPVAYHQRGAFALWKFYAASSTNTDHADANEASSDVPNLWTSRYAYDRGTAHDDGVTAYDGATAHDDGATATNDDAPAADDAPATNDDAPAADDGATAGNDVSIRYAKSSNGTYDGISASYESIISI